MVKVRVSNRKCVSFIISVVDNLNSTWNPLISTQMDTYIYIIGKKHFVFFYYRTKSLLDLITGI